VEDRKDSQLLKYLVIGLENSLVVLEHFLECSCFTQQCFVECVMEWCSTPVFLQEGILVLLFV